MDKSNIVIINYLLNVIKKNSTGSLLFIVYATLKVSQG